jgi:hypothetical protein
LLNRRVAPIATQSPDEAYADHQAHEGHHGTEDGPAEGGSVTDQRIWRLERKAKDAHCPIALQAIAELKACHSLVILQRAQLRQVRRELETAKDTMLALGSSGRGAGY